MRRVTVLAALLLSILAVAAGPQAWKWGSHYHAHPVAGWTWDDDAAVTVDAS